MTPDTTTGKRRFYVPLDVNYREDPKVIGAGPEAELVYLRSLVLAKRLTDRDGHIHKAHLLGLCGDLESIEHGELVPGDIAGRLVASGLWVEADEGWLIAAWLKHNPSAAEIDEARNGEATRKANWRKGKRSEGGDTDQRDKVSHGTPRDATPSNREEKTDTETEGSNPSVDLALVEPPAAPDRIVDSVDAVFIAWCQSTGKTRSVLDPKRRKVITAALKNYPPEDLIAAVRGWKHSPHHRGENERRTVYNDLELVLRDPKHIEEFRDLERGEGTAAVPRMPTGTDMSARWLEEQEQRNAIS